GWITPGANATRDGLSAPRSGRNHAGAREPPDGRAGWRPHSSVSDQTIISRCLRHDPVTQVVLRRAGAASILECLKAPGMNGSLLAKQMRRRGMSGYWIRRTRMEWIGQSLAERRHAICAVGCTVANSLSTHSVP